MLLEEKEFLMERRGFVIGLGAISLIGLTGCSSTLGQDCNTAQTDLQRTACERERAQFVSVTVGMVIGAAAGYVIGRQVGIDPRVGILVGAASGGVIGALADAYANYLLEQSNGRALGAMQSLNTNLDDDIRFQAQEANNMEKQLTVFRSSMERPKSVIDASSDVTAGREQVRAAVKRAEVYQKAPAVYRSSTSIITSKGTKTGTETGEINVQVQQATKSVTVLGGRVQQTDAEIRANITYLTSVGVPI
jgi:hypothetical protein